MQFCSCAGSVLILLLMIFITGSESAAPVVKVKYGGTAVLPCTERCSGVVSWTPSDKSSDTLAECDQTSCRSVKEGYQMIYNQYLQGNLSLIITEADFSKRGLYTCDCDGVDKCDVELQIKALRTPVQKNPGDSLVMELDVSDPVEVIFYSTGSADGSSDHICTVIGGSLQCKPEYKHRTSLLLLSSSSSVLELRDMKESDGGVYIIRIIRNKGDIHIYTLNVISEGLSLTVWKVLTCLLCVLAVGLLVALGWVLKGVKKMKHVKSDIQAMRKDIGIMQSDIRVLKSGKETAEQQREFQETNEEQKIQELHKTIEELNKQIDDHKKDIQMLKNDIKKLQETGQKPELIKKQEQEIEYWERNRAELEPAITLIQSYFKTYIVRKQFLEKITSAETNPLLTERTQGRIIPYIPKNK